MIAAVETTVDRTEPEIFRNSVPPLRTWVSRSVSDPELAGREEPDLQAAAGCLAGAAAGLFEARIYWLSKGLSRGEFVIELGRPGRTNA